MEAHEIAEAIGAVIADLNATHDIGRATVMLQGLVAQIAPVFTDEPAAADEPAAEIETVPTAEIVPFAASIAPVEAPIEPIAADYAPGA